MKLEKVHTCLINGFLIKVSILLLLITNCHFKRVRKVNFNCSQQLIVTKAKKKSDLIFIEYSEYDIGEPILKMKIDSCKLINNVLEIEGYVFYPKPYKGNLITFKSGIEIFLCKRVNTNKWQVFKAIGNTNGEGFFSIKFEVKHSLGIVLYNRKTDKSSIWVM